jgi:hypothetical protein
MTAGTDLEVITPGATEVRPRRRSPGESKTTAGLLTEWRHLPFEMNLFRGRCDTLHAWHLLGCLHGVVWLTRPR